jgi:nucleotide-binding universal stress UspA family protein
MRTFSHILFATDGSENSEQVQEYVKDIAAKFMAKVTILNVYEIPLMINNYEFHAEIYDLVLKEAIHNSDKILEKAKKDLQSINEYVDTLSLQGNPEKVIIETAELKNCDLIVMGTRGLSEFKSFLLGSTSNYVVHHAKCPVFIIPEEK